MGTRLARCSGMTRAHAGLIRGTLLVLFGVGALGACANDVTFGAEDDDDVVGDGTCLTPPPPADGWCPPAWTCVNGQWIDTAGACPDPACPSFEPADGETCPQEGQTCQYDYDEEYPCGDEEWGYTVTVECFDGAWTHISNYCQPEPECPDEAPVAGTDCTGWDEAYFCGYEVETSCGAVWLDAYCEWSEGGQLWNVVLYDPPVCQDGCSAYGGEAGCAADTSCRWLVPGCETGGPNALTEAGCYPAEDCSADSCGAGQTCQTVSYDPCHNQACDSCAAEGAVCL